MDRKKIEKKYQDILRSNPRWALDIEKSVLDLLTYLGHNPITSTRYFWQYAHFGTPDMSIIVAPHMLIPIIDAILIRFHGVPDPVGRKRNRPKTFVSRQRWVQRRSRNATNDRAKKPSKPDKEWLVGLRIYFAKRSGAAKGSGRGLGFAIGRQIIGLYLAEIALKYALDERDIDYQDSHDIEMLYLHLPEEERTNLRRGYTKILHSESGHAWDFQRSIDELIRHLAEDPFTVTRYYWDRPPEDGDVVLFHPERLIPLVDAILSELHGIELAPRKEAYFERDFQSFQASLPGSRAAAHPDG